MPAPTQVYLRRREVWAWLEELGVRREIFQKLVDAGAIARIKLTTNGRGYYLREQIERHFVEPQRQARAGGEASSKQ